MPICIHFSFGHGFALCDNEENQTTNLKDNGQHENITR